eukprot:scaffold7105_cov116-Isochrysis_galbana.AAC.1
MDSAGPDEPSAWRNGATPASEGLCTTAMGSGARHWACVAAARGASGSFCEIAGREGSPAVSTVPPASRARAAAIPAGAAAGPGCGAAVWGEGDGGDGKESRSNASEIPRRSARPSVRYAERLSRSPSASSSSSPAGSDPAPNPLLST